MSLLVDVDDYSSESDVIIIPSALDFVSQDEMLTPLGRLDKGSERSQLIRRFSPERLLHWRTALLSWWRWAREQGRGRKER